MKPRAAHRTAAPRRALSAIRGLTAIEMLVAMVIIAILMTLAAPSFGRYVATQRLRNASYDLVTAMLIARSEAIKRNTPIDVIKVGDDWNAGWQVKSGSTVIREQSAYSKIRISNTATLSTITYSNDGRPSTSTTTFRIEPVNAVSGVTNYCVRIALSGTATSAMGGC